MTVEFDLTEIPDLIAVEDVHEAYQDGYNDALDHAIVLIKAAVKQCRKGGELRHAEVQQLLKSVEVLARE